VFLVNTLNLHYGVVPFPIVSTPHPAPCLFFDDMAASNSSISDHPRQSEPTFQFTPLACLVARWPKVDKCDLNRFNALRTSKVTNGTSTTHNLYHQRLHLPVTRALPIFEHICAQITTAKTQSTLTASRFTLTTKPSRYVPSSSLVVSSARNPTNNGPLRNHSFLQFTAPRSSQHVVFQALEPFCESSCGK
jgi:hypothetical protein